MLFSDARGFDPQTAATTFRIAASDYIDPLFLPQLVAQIKSQAPLCQIEIHPLSSDSDYHAHLSLGQVDVVIGNWLKPPEDLHMARLFGDEIVSLVNKDHPAVRRGWDARELARGRAHRADADASGCARRSSTRCSTRWACSATSRRAARTSG